MVDLGAVLGFAHGRLAPSPRGALLLGHLPLLRPNPLRFFMDAFRDHGEVVRCRFGPVTGHLIASPEGVHHVLVENQKNYGKQTRGFQNLRYVLGNGLLTAEGDFWRRQRRIAQPAFHRQRIATFAETMVRAAEESAQRLEARRGQVVDAAQEMSHLTLRIVGQTLLGYDPTAAADQVSGALEFLLRLANRRTTRLIEVPPLLPVEENRRFRRELAVLDGVVLRMIEERRRNGGDRGDLLSMLMAARDEETGEAMDDRQLRDEVMTIFLAGHETTAMAMTWTLLLLSQHPDWARALRDELDAELGARPVTLADLPRLPRLRATIEEAMRLYPPAWVVTRSVNEADEIGGFDIPPRSIAFVFTYGVHRNPRVWDNPEGFDPARFLNEGERKLPRGAYVPFGAGPRQCIGNNFAMMEAQLLLATLHRRVRLDLLPGHPIEAEPSITLRPRHGMRMTVR